MPAPATTPPAAPALPATGFVAEPVVLAAVGIGRTAWRARVKAGTAPAPVRLGPRTVRWSAADVHAWIERTLQEARVAPPAAAPVPPPRRRPGGAS